MQGHPLGYFHYLLDKVGELLLKENKDIPSLMTSIRLLLGSFYLGVAMISGGICLGVYKILLILQVCH